MSPDRTVPGRLLTGLVGTGIGPSLSPALHEREARALGLECTYARFDLDALGIPADAVGDLIAQAREEGLSGVNVTHPCKQLVIPQLDELSPDAAAIGAVNTVVFDGQRAVGHNTDWSGFRDGFVAGLPDAPLRRVVLLGSGGAGAAAAHALLKLGAESLTVLDTDATRAIRLADDLTARFGADRARAGNGLERELSEADGLVHATPVGMAGHPGLPLPISLLRKELWVAEIVYRPLETPLLRAARALGCRTLDGGPMAVHQAAAALKLFCGREPDPARMLRHLTELVGAETSGGASRVA
ncbi:shikimate dehydrogenase [Amycolatopsis dendrobii]|uniref:Shikimate dehydrogenase (NADP(+)) n=1 Tax=Amycolatopsis dendrobii TaxID=2760662 RepID=A0A7W3W6Y8_9PSEU|nr:shikimate dehydrogenase [Amycolatopsis dendrobii]MBB1159935.1 shikimate dehydrogenase [Amycolatopsis dendrobii]